MGLFYNPPPPYIGGNAPLAPERLDPPISGPAPQNPPRIGARIPVAYYAWVAAATAAIPVFLGAKQPFTKGTLTPQSALAQNPPFTQPVIFKTLTQWQAPPFVLPPSRKNAPLLTLNAAQQLILVVWI